MVKKAGTIKGEIKTEEQGGKGSVEIKPIYRQEELEGNAKLVGLISINPGCSIGLHRHVDEEEIYYILRGQGLIRDNGAEERVTSGDAHLLKSGGCHAIENTGSEPLEFLALILPC